jgi:HD-GYP domain-containing protein (c-di-GMP phosphodiesterase class II)
MVLSQDLYGFQNELMLSRGIELTAMEIKRIQQHGYQGAYIIDGLSQDIEVKSLISTALKNNTVRAIKNVFRSAGHRQDGRPSPQLGEVKTLVYDIVSEIIYNQNATINMMDLKIFDDYTYYHSVNVAVISIVIGAAEGLGKTALYQLGLGALLHDIGKVFVPKEILEKPGKLTPEEFEEIKKHSFLGNRYLREKWNVPGESNVAVLSHHEKYNGTGYPYGIKADKIPYFARIVAVADVYDALTSDRAYRKAMSPSEAIEYVMGGAGMLFDPHVVKRFSQKIIPYPSGTCVSLSNGETAIVVESSPSCGTRPKVRLISGAQQGAVWNLYDDRKLLSVTVTGVAQT